MDQYTEAHLIVSAIRLLKHKSGGQPAVEDVCRMVEISTEAGLALCRKLAEKNIVQTYEDPFSIRVDIKDHLQIETLPKTEIPEDNISGDLERFMAKKQQESKKIETIQAELDKKRQDKFSDIEAQLKKQFKSS